MKAVLRRHSFSIAFALLVFAFFFTRPGPGSQATLQLTGATMGTTYQLQFVELPTSISMLQLQQQISTLLHMLDREIFSTYAVDSELSRFNRAPVNVPFAVSVQMLEVAVLARQISELTGGAFDITVGPLVNLWGFGPTASAVPAVLPTDASIAEARTRVGYQYLLIDASASTFTKTADIYVDMSAIAKGYAVDEVAALFDQLGIQDYFLEIGGELKIKGYKPGQQSWVPAIERPQDTAPEVYAVLYSKGEELALAGSGDYRNYFNADGQRYSHEIDPQTGRPVTHNLAAVYVIDSSSARSDALATAFMVLGYEAGRILAEQLQLGVYFIYRAEAGEFAEYSTAQFARYLTL